jgi:hypothetical protein
MKPRFDDEILWVCFVGSLLCVIAAQLGVA